jgi:hypothetical protein
MTQYIEDFLPPIQSAGLNTQENVSISGTLASGTQTVTGNNVVTGGVTVESSTSVPASAGAVAAGKPITLFSNGPSIYVTSDAPAFTAVKGSLCINTAGSSTSTRLYVNTDGGTTWTNVTTAA